MSKVESICRNIRSKACIRFLLACLLAKIDRPDIDIRKPYTEIGDPDCYSGRSYDETYVEPFVIKHNLPCNLTTAFLTPAFRTKNITLTPDIDLGGRPKELYQDTLQLVTDVHEGKVSPESLLIEVVRNLLVIKNERQERLNAMLAELRSKGDELPLSSEDIVCLIQQHLNCPNTSRLPVLVVAAAYQAADKYLKERVLSLYPHVAADKQTGALGDVEITLMDDDRVVTSYEMKDRRVTKDDIDIALRKIANSGRRIDNYIFITTDIIDDDVNSYAKNMYEKTGGIEFVILDCIGFLRHFLHLFHRIRLQYLEAYQQLVLEQPESAVRQELKEAFLALRRAAESASGS
ncbi:restriction endonuclease, SacI family [Dehalococcoidales bacterium]|nr:restriction endonuclease, SacI family [Dehalococcoidales bacterium]